MRNGEGERPIDPSGSARSYEVGYGKPPKEHQFKAGHRRKPRVRADAERSLPSGTLWAVLNEVRSININGKPASMRNAEIIVRRLVEKAEKGNSSLTALLQTLMMMTEAEAQEPEDAFTVVVNRNQPTNAT